MLIASESVVAMPSYALSTTTCGTGTLGRVVGVPIRIVRTPPETAPGWLR